ncbi:MAG: hypothetical protein LBV06_01805 [Propionibacteriaceae bacterium]|jgi:hypothetical protein|nr:hypothetical protein [Propionibacteriaceae bacterium]
MAYKVIRVLASAFVDRFKKAETDTDFKAEAYGALDDFLSTMEERGWSVVSVSPDSGSSGYAYLYVTLHRPET